MWNHAPGSLSSPKRNRPGQSSYKSFTSVLNDLKGGSVPPLGGFGCSLLLNETGRKPETEPMDNRSPGSLIYYVLDAGLIVARSGRPERFGETRGRVSRGSEGGSMCWALVVGRVSACYPSGDETTSVGHERLWRQLFSTSPRPCVLLCQSTCIWCRPAVPFSRFLHLAAIV